MRGQHWMDEHMIFQVRKSRAAGVCRPASRGVWFAAAFMMGVLYLEGGPVAGALEAQTSMQDRLRLQAQKAQYDANVPKTIVELQQFRTERTVNQPAGGTISLISLNPDINSWFLLKVRGAKDRAARQYHLENVNPATQKITLESTPRTHIMVTGPSGVYRCIPWQGTHDQLARARGSGLPFAPICGGRIYLRNVVHGSRTTLEATTEFLRDNVWMGESIVGFVKSAFFKDSQMETAKQVKARTEGVLPEGLVPTRMQQAPVIQARMRLKLEGAPKDRIRMGAWYPVQNLPGVYATAIQPALISRDILRDGGAANPLDAKESRALSYLVAFDMTRFKLGYEVGTTHPRVNWSSRPSGAGRDDRLPGPDGIGTVRPLVNTGMISPRDAKLAIATFTAGFKRDHGAFRWGPNATRDHGKHYGFLVHGVVESKLKNDLATLFVLDDGSIHMKTWQESDNKLLAHIRFARQNGVPLVVRDAKTGQPTPGALVRYWGPGNWSGSAKADLRTLRAGVCMRTTKTKQYLIYGYFSTATPSAMARTFQAISCDYAMLLDMNALEHTYLSLFVRNNGGIQTEHLVAGMALVDRRKRNGKRVPRFLAYPDNRDFFYLMRKDNPN